MRARANQPVTPMTRESSRMSGVPNERKQQYLRKQTGHALTQFDHAHHGGVRHVGSHAGRASVPEAEHGNDRRAQKSHGQRCAASSPDDGIDVPPERIRAEPELGVRRMIDKAEMKNVGIMPRELVGKTDRPSRSAQKADRPAPWPRGSDASGRGGRRRENDSHDALRQAERTTLSYASAFRALHAGVDDFVDGLRQRMLLTMTRNPASNDQ